MLPLILDIILTLSVALAAAVSDLGTNPRKNWPPWWCLLQWPGNSVPPMVSIIVFIWHIFNDLHIVGGHVRHSLKILVNNVHRLPLLLPGWTIKWPFGAMFQLNTALSVDYISTSLPVSNFIWLWQYYPKLYIDWRTDPKPTWFSIWSAQYF